MLVASQVETLRHEWTRIRRSMNQTNVLVFPKHRCSSLRCTFITSDKISLCLLSGNLHFCSNKKCLDTRQLHFKSRRHKHGHHHHHREAICTVTGHRRQSSFAGTQMTPVSMSTSFKQKVYHKAKFVSLGGQTQSLLTFPLPNLDQAQQHARCRRFQQQVSHNNQGQSLTKKLRQTDWTQPQLPLDAISFRIQLTTSTSPKKATTSVLDYVSITQILQGRPPPVYQGLPPDLMTLHPHTDQTQLTTPTNPSPETVPIHAPILHQQTKQLHQFYRQWMTSEQHHKQVWQSIQQPSLPSISTIGGLSPLFVPWTQSSQSFTSLNTSSTSSSLSPQLRSLSSSRSLLSPTFSFHLSTPNASRMCRNPDPPQTPSFQVIGALNSETTPCFRRLSPTDQARLFEDTKQQHKRLRRSVIVHPPHPQPQPSPIFQRMSRARCQRWNTDQHHRFLSSRSVHVYLCQLDHFRLVLREKEIKGKSSLIGLGAEREGHLRTNVSSSSRQRPFSNEASTYFSIQHTHSNKTQVTLHQWTQSLLRLCREYIEHWIPNWDVLISTTDSLRFTQTVVRLWLLFIARFEQLINKTKYTLEQHVIVCLVLAQRGVRHHQDIIIDKLQHLPPDLKHQFTQAKFNLELTVHRGLFMVKKATLLDNCDRALRIKGVGQRRRK